MRYGKPIKNKKHSDPRYFLNEREKLEELNTPEEATLSTAPTAFSQEYDPVVYGSEASRLGLHGGAQKALAANRSRLEDLLVREEFTKAGNMLGDQLHKLGFTDWTQIDQLRHIASRYLEQSTT